MTEIAEGGEVLYGKKVQWNNVAVVGKLVLHNCVNILVTDTVGI